jgi:hypothetical protein
MRQLALFVLALATLAPAAALAQPFAQPPDSQGPMVATSRPNEPTYDRPPVPDDLFASRPRSTVRLMTGPVLRISEHSPDGGLYTAVDVGEKAAGLRLSGAWVRVGGERGLSQYGGELWLDFNYEGPLHPILGAGASAARLQLAGASGATSTYTIGVGMLRGTLQYALPIRDTDARASIDVVGAVPAIRGSDAPDTSAYVLALATVGVGF